MRAILSLGLPCVGAHRKPQLQMCWPCALARRPRGCRQVGCTGPDLEKTCLEPDVVLSRSEQAASRWQGQGQETPSSGRSVSGTEHTVGAQRVLVELNWEQQMFAPPSAC